MKKVFLLFIIVYCMFMCCCKNDNSPIYIPIFVPVYGTETEEENSDYTEYIFYRAEMGCDISAYQRTHKITEYHCKDLGDSFYEVTTYKVHYFAASNGGNGATHYNNGVYKNKTVGQLVEIVRNRSVTPDCIEKHITNQTISRRITDYVTNNEVVVYIPNKIKNDGYYYGITKM